MWFIKIHILLDCREHTKKFTDVTSQCMLIINLKILYEVKQFYENICTILLDSEYSVVTRKLYPEAERISYLIQSKNLIFNC